MNDRAFNCIVAGAVAVALLLAVFMMNGAALGIVRPVRTADYPERLFDRSFVHEIDISMPDWDSWIVHAAREEYAAVTVTIDGEKLPNVGFRAKGNGSLLAVAMMASERYSFKLEFDRFEDRQTYHGLDKLCLNNLVEDTTYMKDLLVYESMREMGVPSPLVSYAFVTVNGEDFGLYMCVEGIEDGFIERYYGRNDSGKLYKPDNVSVTDFGIGVDFNIFKFLGFVLDSVDMSSLEDMDLSQYEGMTMDEFTAQQGIDEEGFESSFGDGGTSFGDESGETASAYDSLLSRPEDVLLKYIDDSPASYPNIFDKAKSKPAYNDQMRLIAALKRLSAREDIENTVDVDEVIRYFAVHNLFVNSDSYTGMSVHNYYLYERDGVLSMLPWDYNMACGTMLMRAEYAINDPIDQPMAVRVNGEHPMFDWITADEGYKARYYACLGEVMDAMDYNGLVDETAELIRPWVERDPTKFVSMEEFDAGCAMLKEYMQRRMMSVRYQLSGEIPATKAGQAEHPEKRVSTEGINLHAMGDVTMGIADERRDLSSVEDMAEGSGSGGANSGE